MQEHSVEITLTHPDDLFHLFGSNERHLRLMEQEFGVTIHARTEIVQIIGEEETCEQVRQVIQALFGPRQPWHDHWNAGCGDRHYHGEEWGIG